MNNKNFFLSSKGAIAEEGTIWLMAQHIDSLLKIDICSKKCVGCYPLPGQKGMDALHASICKNGNNIYIFPFNGKGIYKFDIKAERFEEIQTDDVISKEGKRFWGWISFSYKDYVFFVGEGQEGLYRINVKNDNVQKYTGYVKEYKNKTEQAGQIFSDSFLVEGNVLYVPGFKSNIIVEFDLEKLNHRFIVLDKSEDIKLRTINRLDDKLLLTTYNRTEILWQEGTNYKTNEFDWCERETEYFYRVYVFNNTVYYIPATMNKLYCRTGDELITIDLPIEKNETDGFEYDYVFIGENIIFFQTKDDGKIFYFDIDAKKMGEIDIEIDESLIKKNAFIMMDQKIINTKTIWESSRWDLEAFIRGV